MAVKILNAVNHIQDGTGGLEASMTQKELKQKILKRYLKINMRIWDDNIKMYVKETRFVFKLNSSLKHEQSEIFGNVNDVILN
jgi:hypothetical protein